MLAAGFAGGELTLRLDRDVVECDQSSPRSVWVIRARTAAVPDELLAAAGKIADVEIEEDMLSLYADFAADPIDIECTAISETYEPYTSADLAAKARALAHLYTRASERHNDAYGKLTRLRNDLSRLLGRELASAEQRRQFFAERSPERAATLERMISLLERIRGRVEED